MPTSEPPLSGSIAPVPASTVWICHVPPTFAANLSDALSRSKYVTIGVPSGPTWMLVYMPTSVPASVMPPRIIEPGTSGITSGTPSTHSHVVSGIRPVITLATTRSPCDSAYADTHAVPSEPTATAEYGPMRPTGTSLAHTQAWSMQNGSWPFAQVSGGQSIAVSHAWLLVLAAAAAGGEREQRRQREPRAAELQDLLAAAGRQQHQADDRDQRDRARTRHRTGVALAAHAVAHAVERRDELARDVPRLVLRIHGELAVLEVRAHLVAREAERVRHPRRLRRARARLAVRDLDVVADRMSVAVIVAVSLSSTVSWPNAGGTESMMTSVVGWYTTVW